MGVVKNLLGTLTGGLLGQADIPKAKEARKQAAGTDPNRGAEIAAARRRQAAASQGRSSFRIDLGSGASNEAGKTTRGGVSIS